MSEDQDWNKKSIRILTKKDGNTKCADCGEPGENILKRK